MEVDIYQLISTLGFPIVAYLLLFFKMDKSLKMLADAVESLKLLIEKRLE